MSGALRIYIAGPYSAKTPEQTLKNVEAAMDAGIRLYSKGHFPYIPHLTHFIDIRASKIGVVLKWEDYIKWDMAWLSMCDAVLYLGSSRGADYELQAANAMGKSVFYSVDDVWSSGEKSDGLSPA